MRNSRSAFCFIPQVTTEPTVPLPMQQWSLNNAPLESVRLLREYVRKFLKFSVSSVFRQTLSVQSPAGGRGREGEREGGNEGGRDGGGRDGEREREWRGEGPVHDPHFQVRDPNKARPVTVRGPQKGRSGTSLKTRLFAKNTFRAETGGLVGAGSKCVHGVSGVGGGMSRSVNAEEGCGVKERANKNVHTSTPCARCRGSRKVQKKNLISAFHGEFV